MFYIKLALIKINITEWEISFAEGLFTLTGFTTGLHLNGELGKFNWEVCT